MIEIYVHPHALKHGLSEDEIKFAWSNYVRSQPRSAPNEDHEVRIGFGKKTPRAIQMIGVVKDYGVLIYHAMTPPQSSVESELRLNGGRK